MPVIEEQIKVINHRIDDLEREAKNYYAYQPFFQAVQF